MKTLNPVEKTGSELKQEATFNLDIIYLLACVQLLAFFKLSGIVVLVWVKLSSVKVNFDWHEAAPAHSNTSDT